MTTRRDFFKQIALTSTSLATVSGRCRAADADSDTGDWPIAIFEKVFEALHYEELAEAIVQIGADGVEATIRPKGHIEPAAAADEVPKMAEAMRVRGKRIVIAATHIRSVDEPYTETLLKTFKSVGIKHYRMSHYYLDHTKPLKEQISRYAAMATELAALNRDVGIQGLYQTHAGARYLGALAWDAAYMLDGIDPDSLGIAFDVRHVRADTGSSWRTAAQLLRPHIRSIYVKDAIWGGTRTDRLQNVPVDTGFVGKEMFQFVRQGLPAMPLCLHMEHLGYRVFEKHEIPSAITAHQKDIEALRRWMSP